MSNLSPLSEEERAELVAYLDGELPKRADPELLADALLGPIVMRRLMFAKPLSPKQVAALVDQVLPTR